MRKVNLLILAILPLFLLYIGFFYKEHAAYYLTSVDPEYCYLFSGLNIAHLKFPWHIDHPGSPLQLLSGIVIRIVHLIHDHGTLDQDVFKNPELFLFYIQTAIFLLHAIAIFITGYLISKVSGSLELGVFFQLTPFVSFSVISLLNRIIVEHLFITIILCLILITFLYIKDLNIKKRIVDNYLLMFALITGIGIATKVLFAPLLVIPLLLLPGIKKKIVFLLLTILSFAIFALPVFNRWNYFTHWIKVLFIHSGQYGSGASNIVDTSSFISNIKTIFSTDVFFPVIFFVLITSCLIYYLPFFKVKIKNDLYFKGLMGVTIAVILIIIVVAKQFKYFYLTPALLLMILGLYFVLAIYSRPFPILKKKIIIIPCLIIFLFCTYYFEVRKVFIYHSYHVNRNESFILTQNKIQKNYLLKPTLILSNYYGAPYKEYSLFLGINYCDEKMRNKYSSTLKTLYPDIYIYHGWNNLFNTWDNSASFIYLLRKYNNLILFSGDPVLENSLNSKIHGVNRQFDTKFNIVYFNETTKETIYEISYDSVLANSIKTFDCNAEIVDSSGNYFININGQTFSDGITQSQEKAKSGAYSSKLTKEAPYGMTAVLSEVITGEHYRFSVWKYNNKNENTGLVVSAQDSKIFYMLQTESLIKDSEWLELQIDLVIPEILNNQDIKIYCWNSNNDLPAYFDDLTIEKLPQ
ncbi:MAG: hypothetical protein HY738_23650 [Bacteroidia bacterium]|nr:hypothetical protein [Bacteroidia bacterium]